MYNARKLLVGMFSTFLLMLLILYPTKVYAATQISSIRIKVVEQSSNEENPKVQCDTSGCFIIPDSIVWDKDVKDCEAGEIPEVSFKIDTKEGFVFKDDFKKNKVQVTNGECFYLYYDEQGKMVMRIKYAVHGKLDFPDDAYWDENHPGRARWEKVSDKVTYTIQLCRGSQKETIATGVTKTSYDLSSKLQEAYYYDRDNVYFRVKAVPKSNYSKQFDSSDYIESEYFDYWEDLDDDSPRFYPSYVQYKERWDFTNGKWRYYNNAGQLVKNNWAYVNGHWYHFDQEGWMETGWQFINDNWYYFNTYNNNGDMLIGWQYINGYWYYFDIYNGFMSRDRYIPSADGKMVYYIKSDGKMQTGWVNYYGDKYIDPVSGVVTMTK